MIIYIQIKKKLLCETFVCASVLIEWLHIPYTEKTRKVDRNDLS